MKNNNYKILQAVHTYIKGKRNKQITIKDKSMAWRRAFPIMSIAWIVKLTPHFLIPKKGFLIELNSLDLVTERWYDQFLKSRLDRTYILYVQLIFSDIPFVLSYKITFTAAAHLGPVEDDFIFFDRIREEIVNQTDRQMKINGIYDQYLDSLKSHNLFYRARWIYKKSAKSKSRRKK